MRDPLNRIATCIPGASTTGSVGTSAPARSTPRSGSTGACSASPTGRSSSTTSCSPAAAPMRAGPGPRGRRRLLDVLVDDYVSSFELMPRCSTAAGSTGEPSSRRSWSRTSPGGRLVSLARGQRVQARRIPVVRARRVPLPRPQEPPVVAPPGAHLARVWWAEAAAVPPTSAPRWAPSSAATTATTGGSRVSFPPSHERSSRGAMADTVDDTTAARVDSDAERFVPARSTAARHADDGAVVIDVASRRGAAPQRHGLPRLADPR